MTKLNIKAIHELLDYLDEHPDRFKMQEWAAAFSTDIKEVEEGTCKTTACLGGTACILGGYKLEFYEDMILVPNVDFRPDDENSDPYMELRGFVADRVVAPEGEQTGAPIEDVAERLLGLTSGQAGDIFYQTEIRTPAEAREAFTRVTGHDFSK